MSVIELKEQIAALKSEDRRELAALISDLDRKENRPARMVASEKFKKDDLQTIRRNVETLMRIRRIQNDPKWIGELRDQYNPAVSKRTLELNEEFPLQAG